MGTVATDNPVQQMQHVQHPAVQIPDKQGRPPTTQAGWWGAFLVCQASTGDTTPIAGSKSQW